MKAEISAMRKLNKRSVNKLTQARNTFLLATWLPHSQIRASVQCCFVQPKGYQSLLTCMCLLSPPEHLIGLELAIFNSQSNPLTHWTINLCQETRIFDQHAICVSNMPYFAQACNLSRIFQIFGRANSLSWILFVL